jgi:hypothetical protein
MRGWVVDQNGLDQNGLDQNGLDQNGLDQNGLDQNGLDQNGLDQNGESAGVLCEALCDLCVLCGSKKRVFGAWFERAAVKV